MPDYAQGKGIAYYPPHGIGKKVARIHSSSGQTNESESAFNLLYGYLNTRKWCENKSQNPWVIFELTDYYNIEKTVFRDVAPYESGNGNVPEYRIYTGITGTADGDWKEIVHKTQQQSIDVKEDRFDIPEEARYIKFVASRGTRTDNGNPENAIRIYGFDIYGSFSRAVDRGNVVSVGKTVLGFYDASDYYCQPLHLLDGDVTNQSNRWYFDRAGENDSLKYVLIDLENEYEIAKFVLYDAGNFEAQTYNIDGYNIYVSTSAPNLSLISSREDKNTVWTKVVDTKGRRSDNVKTDNIEPFPARYVKLEIPRSRTYGAVRLYQFEVHKKDNDLGIAPENLSRASVAISSTLLTAGESVSIRSLKDGIFLAEAALYDVAGSNVFRKSITDMEYTLPLPALAGVYVLSVGLADGTLKIFKVLVK
ncbi:MAG: discoidin domain-containing protein [Dysgonamonadaceae bacterium]|nr:discoidin domain-containing protein [Dysgonamonadaceae bacterium]